MRQAITEAFWQDFRLALRQLTRKPGFTAAAVLSLALGIGANTAIFSVVNTVLLRPLPYHEPERLVEVLETFTRPDGRARRGTVSVPNVRDWQERNRSFEGIGVYRTLSFNLMSDAPLRTEGAAVTPELFPLLGVEPLLGRSFQPGVDSNDDRVVVLSYRLWQSFFGGDSEIVGETLRIDGRPCTVLGVMPREFRFPPRSAVQLWTPEWDYQTLAADRGMHWLVAVGRLKPGVTLSAAQEEMDVVARGLEQEYPEFQDQRGISLQVLSESLVERTRPVLLALWGAVGFVLLIACGNVANLLLARAAGRRRELAVRAALGAGRWRLVQQMLIESGLLATAGGAVGLAVGYLAVGYLASLPGTTLPQGQEVAFDFVVLAVCAVAALVSAALSGLVPALRASRINLRDAMQERGSLPSAASHRDPIRSALVAAEVALALVVLIGAGLVLNSFLSLRNIDPGLRTKGVLTLGVPLPETGYESPEAIVAFYQRLLERLNALPGVESSGMINHLPIQVTGWNGDFCIHGRAPLPPSQRPVANFRRVSGDYFQTLGIPLLAGRFFEPTEASPVALINQTLARSYWPGEDPVGQRIIPDPEAPPEDWLTIVGVVGDVKNVGLDRETLGDVYFPFTWSPRREMTVVVRSGVEPTGLAAMVRREVQSIDPRQPVYRVATMKEVVATFLSSWGFNAILFTFFAILALILAMLGVYGVMSYNVSQRTYEIGLRMALGARRGDVLRLIVRQGLVVTALGAAAGIAGAVGLTRFLSSQLYGLEAVDLPTFAVVTLVLFIVALVACALPARRASSVEPVVALHDE